MYVKLLQALAYVTLAFASMEKEDVEKNVKTLPDQFFMSSWKSDYDKLDRRMPVKDQKTYVRSYHVIRFARQSSDMFTVDIRHFDVFENKSDIVETPLLSGTFKLHANGQKMQCGTQKCLVNVVYGTQRVHFDTFIDGKEQNCIEVAIVRPQGDGMSHAAIMANLVIVKKEAEKSDTDTDSDDSFWDDDNTDWFALQPEENVRRRSESRTSTARRRSSTTASARRTPSRRR